MADHFPAPPPAGTGAHPLVNSPIAEHALARLVDMVTQAARATPTVPQQVLDIGCGWGEVLIQVLQALPGATGHGLDIHEPDIARARNLATRRGVQDRVTFSAADASAHRDSADVVINIGAYHALGNPAQALAGLHARTRAGGRALFGLEYWRAEPTDSELASMWPDASADDCLYLPDLVALIQRSGWRILDWHDSTQAELDAYEVNLLRDREEWLLDHPGHPVREDLDRTWTSWLRGHRRAMGFAAVVLGRTEPVGAGAGDTEQG